MYSVTREGFLLGTLMTLMAEYELLLHLSLYVAHEVPQWH